MPERLYLHEEALLLALCDRQGTIAMGARYGYALGGALLAELLLERRVVIEEDRNRLFLRIVDTTPFGDPLLDECLVKLQTASRRAQLRHWVARFSNIASLKNRVAGQLCKKGVLREEEGKVLLLFRRKLYPELNPVPERRILKKLSGAIFTDSASINPRTVVLLSLAHHTHLLAVNFDRKELKKRKARIEMITNGELCGRATKEAIAAMQAAVVAIAVLPAMTAAVT